MLNGVSISRHRYLSLWLMRLATDRIVRQRAAPDPRPLVVTGRQGNVERLTAVDAAAANLGLAPSFLGGYGTYADRCGCEGQAMSGCEDFIVWHCSCRLAWEGRAVKRRPRTASQCGFSSCTQRPCSRLERRPVTSGKFLVRHIGEAWISLCFGRRSLLDRPQSPHGAQH